VWLSRPRLASIPGKGASLEPNRGVLCVSGDGRLNCQNPRRARLNARLAGARQVFTIRPEFDGSWPVVAGASVALSHDMAFSRPKRHGGRCGRHRPFIGTPGRGWLPAAPHGGEHIAEGGRRRRTVALAPGMTAFRAQHPGRTDRVRCDRGFHGSARLLTVRSRS
jgi:hypothetical protein